MKWRHVHAACFLVVATSWHLGAVAQTGDIRSQISTLEREASTLSQQVTAKQRQIDALRSRPSPEQQELVEARRAVDDARAQYKAVNSADNESKLKNAEFKYTLAERKYDKANGEVTSLKAEIDSLKQQIASRQRQVKTLQQQAAEVAAVPKPAAVDPKQQQRVAEERAKQRQQEQELEKTRQMNDAAQKEIERLKALLANKEAANAGAAAAKPAAAVTATTAASAAAAPAAAPTTKIAASAGTAGLQRLTTTTEVVAALQALAQRAPTEARRNKEVNEVAYFKRQLNGKDADKAMASLRALGNSQFRGEVKLNPGNYIVVLGSHRWPVEIADISPSTPFVVLLDYSDAAKPKLQYYKAALEG